MATTRRQLTLNDILKLCRRQVDLYGGSFSDRLLNPDPLIHTLEKIETSIFGFTPYPTIVEKAAAICWCIIKSHVFVDANKRTGYAACELYLERHGYLVVGTGPDPIDDIYQMMMKIARNEATFKQLVSWLRKRTFKP